MSPRPGEVFAGYTIVRELGAGGMGSVYLARHPRLPRYDALKLLRAELCDDPSFVGRFEREAETVAQLDHPNIVSVHDRGSQDGQLWISMRFIDGTTAERALADQPAGLAPDRVVRIVGKVASALDYAHRHHLLHRDVKPANILLQNASEEDGTDQEGPGGEPDVEFERVFLSDFGVAKAIGAAAERLSSLTSTGSVVATLDYASPEQIKGQVLDHRSDIYALGCVLYKLLTGTVPFPGESVAARVYGHLNAEPPPPTSLVPTLPLGFDQVVATAMAKDPHDRYPTCRALAQAARDALDAPVVPVDAPAPPPDGDLPTTIMPAVEPHPGSRTGPSGGPPSVPPPTSPFGSHQAPQDPASQESQPAVPQGSQPVARQGSQPVARQGSQPVARQESRKQPEVPARVDSQVVAQRSRRTVLIGAGIAAVVVLATGVVLFMLRSGDGGTAGPVGGTSSAATASTSEAGAGPLSAASSPGASSPANSPANSPVAPSLAPPGPVPGLPHSTPLPEQVLIGSRVVAGVSDLYQFDAQTGAIGNRITTGSPGSQFPILSPDRGSVIYVQTVGGSPSTLRTVAVDGSGDRELFTIPADCSTVYRPAWDPADPTTLALPCVKADGTVEIRLLSVTGAPARTLDIGFPVVDDVAFSPDGRSIAFWAAEAQGVEGAIYLQTVAAGAAAPTRLVQPAEGTGDADPVFSPDGSLIAFRRLGRGADGAVTAQLFVVGTDGANLTPITDGKSVDQDPIFSPDGTRLAFKSNRPNAAGTRDNQLWVIGPDGSDPKELGAGQPGTGDGAPAWGHR